MSTDPDLLADINRVCRIEGHFVLRSGATSSVYFDKYQFEAHPELLGRVADALVPLLPSTAQVLGALELGGVPIGVALSSRTGLPLTLVRKTPKEYGTRRLAEGAEIDGRNVLLVEDVVTSGGQILLSTADLRARGAEVTHALCVIDREAGGGEALAGEGIELSSLATRSELERVTQR